MKYMSHNINFESDDDQEEASYYNKSMSVEESSLTEDSDGTLLSHVEFEK